MNVRCPEVRYSPGMILVRVLCVVGANRLPYLGDAGAVVSVGQILLRRQAHPMGLPMTHNRLRKRHDDDNIHAILLTLMYTI